MGVINAVIRMSESMFSLIIKMIVVLLVIAFAMVTVIMLISAWPFTISLLVGLVLCETFYRKVSESINCKLPEYFYIGIEDFLCTFSEGDERVEEVRADLEVKRQKAEQEVAVMHEALRSADEQLAQIKAKRSLKTLFGKSPSEISERAAKALEMELGKPRWAQYINKANTVESAWEYLFA